MNFELAECVLQELIEAGCQEFVVCPGARNVPFVNVLINEKPLKKWWGFEERSSAFFALGLSRKSKKPVAVITTSGTAVAELLPAVMEAYFTGVPLVLLTADRPRRFRYSGAPQTCDQTHLFGQYAPHFLDLSAGETPDLSTWRAQAPLHVNVSFEEPEKAYKETAPLGYSLFKMNTFSLPTPNLDFFLNDAEKLLTIVSTLPQEAHGPVLQFLKALGGDVYAEAVSGLREKVDNVEPDIKNYTHVLRIGGVPTHRIWRDIEEKGNVKVLSLTRQPFSGISWSDYLLADLCHFNLPSSPKPSVMPIKEQKNGVYYDLSCRFPKNSLIYVGNSLPIRQWDLEAVKEDRGFKVLASRGLNGIDGQLSTFLGLVEPGRHNFAILGDLTTLYDLSAPWFLTQVKAENITLIVMNNYGGRIFEKMFPMEEMLNKHAISFEHVANLWNLPYEKWDALPEGEDLFIKGGRRLVEITC